MGISGTSNAMNGGEGDDTLLSIGSNILYGENGDDWVGCSGDNNWLFGNAGNDYSAASGNNNTLDGGTGNDTHVAGAHVGDRSFSTPVTVWTALPISRGTKSAGPMSSI